MKYYKLNNEVYAYEVDGSQDHLIGNKTAMTALEVEAHINPPKTAKQLQAEVNATSLAYLASTDWYVTRQAETGVAIPADVVTARAEARLKAVGA